jgi:nicotinate-nucleotide adenylyltransferase
VAGLIGVFGGSFDPPHLGHLILADEGRTGLGLERVLWVVTADPPHKPQRPLTPIQDRVEMVRLAIQDEPTFELSLLEIERPGPHYAVETVRFLREHTGVELVYLMGGDSLRDLMSWRDPQGLVGLCKKIGVMNRVGAEPRLDALKGELPALEDKVEFFEAPLIDISSSMIRERIAERRPCKYFLLPPVADYILDNRLYLD